MAQRLRRPKLPPLKYDKKKFKVARNPGAKSVPKLKKQGYKKAGPKLGKNTYVKKITPKKVVTKSTAPATPAPAPGPYDKYKGIPGAVSTLQNIDAQSVAHQGFGNNVKEWLAGQLNPIQQGGADMAQRYAGMAGAMAGTAALPNMMPNATIGGGQTGINAGSATYLQDAQRTMGAGVAASGAQAAGYQGFMQEQANRNLASGLNAGFAQSLLEVPGRYNAAKREYMIKLDETLFEIEQANAKAEADWKLEEFKAANDRYKAKLNFIGTLSGQDAKIATAALGADTKIATTNATNQTRLTTNREQIASRERIADANNRTKAMIANTGNRIKAAKLAVDNAKTTADKKLKLAKFNQSVQKEFDRLWTGEAPDPLKPGSGFGWRYTAKGKQGRAKAAIQAVAWAAASGVSNAKVWALLKSKGFSAAEFQAAVRHVEGGATGF